MDSTRESSAVITVATPQPISFKPTEQNGKATYDSFRRPIDLYSEGLSKNRKKDQQGHSALCQTRAKYPRIKSIPER